MRINAVGEVIRILAICLVLTPASAAAETFQGSAKGTLTVDGKTTPLTYAYARAQKGFFDPSKENIRVLLSDVPISEETLSDSFAPQKLAADGKLHAVEVILDSTGQPVSGGLLHEAFSRTQGFVSVAGMHRFEPTTFNAQLVEGRLWMEKPDEFMNKTFSYSGTFRAAVWHPPAPTASGGAAARTAPGQAAREFLVAARSGNKTAIQKLVTAELGRELDGAQSKEMLDFFKKTTPDPATAEIESVDIQGDTASVDVVEKSKDASVTSHYSLKLENGRWKVAGM